MIKLIAGPCVIEDFDTTYLIAKKLKEISSFYHIEIIFKASFDKANRTSIKSFRGPGLARGLEILSVIKKDFNFEILTDVHEQNQIADVAKTADIIQIPAFLSRQTDLIVSAAKTGKTINIKKGQFMAPWDVPHIIEKINSVNNHKILITERGTSFGYGRLVVDMTSIYELKLLGYPVVFDATHSVQLPGMMSSSSGGNPKYIKTLTKAAIASGADIIFMETHLDPKSALSDGKNMIQIDELFDFVPELLRISKVVKNDSSKSEK